MKVSLSGLMAGALFGATPRVRSQSASASSFGVDDTDHWIHQTLLKETGTSADMLKTLKLLNQEGTLSYERWRSAALMRILFNLPAWRLPLLPNSMILSFPVSTSDPQQGLRMSLFTDDRFFEVFKQANPGSYLAPEAASLKSIFESSASLFTTPNPEQRCTMMCLNPTPGKPSAASPSITLPIGQEMFQHYYLVIKSDQIYRSRVQCESDQRLSDECKKEIKTAPLFVFQVGEGGLYANGFGGPSQKLVVCTGIDVALRFIAMLENQGQFDVEKAMVSFSSVVDVAEEHGLQVAFVFDCFDAQSNILITSVPSYELSTW